MHDLLINVSERIITLSDRLTCPSCRTAKMPKNVNTENNFKSQCHEFFAAVFQQLKTKS